MVMPNGLNGLDLIKRFRADRPELKAIITSGYSLDLAHGRLPAHEQVAYLPKPYEVSSLIASVRNALTGQPSAHRGWTCDEPGSN